MLKHINLDCSAVGKNFDLLKGEGFIQKISQGYTKTIWDGPVAYGDIYGSPNAVYIYYNDAQFDNMKDFELFSSWKFKFLDYQWNTFTGSSVEGSNPVPNGLNINFDKLLDWRFSTISYYGKLGI